MRGDAIGSLRTSGLRCAYRIVIAILILDDANRQADDAFIGRSLFSLQERSARAVGGMIARVSTAVSTFVMAALFVAACQPGSGGSGTPGSGGTSGGGGTSGAAGTTGTAGSSGVAGAVGAGGGPGGAGTSGTAGDHGRRRHHRHGGHDRHRGRGREHGQWGRGGSAAGTTGIGGTGGRGGSSAGTGGQGGTGGTGLTCGTPVPGTGYTVDATGVTFTLSAGPDEAAGLQGRHHPRPVHDGAYASRQDVSVREQRLEHTELLRRRGLGDRDHYDCRG